MIAGLHKKQDKIQTKTLPCIVCDRPIFLSGYGVDTKDDKVKVQEHKKAIALECLAELIVHYGSFLAKHTQYLTSEQQERLKNLEVTNQEYLEELERMTPIAQEKPRLAYLMGWLNEIGKLDVEESPEGILKQFKKDMDELSGGGEN